MKKIFLNLNFDDFHPQKDPDFGGDPESGIFLLFKKLLKDFPGLKITLFTVANWIDKPRQGPNFFFYLKEKFGFKVIEPYKTEPFRIDKHLNWSKEVRRLAEENKFEIAIHGYYHCNPYLFSHSQEFKNLGEKETEERILKAEELFKKMEIPFKKIFRPPGWGMSENLIKVLKKLNYKIISIFPSELKISKFGFLEGLLIPPQNFRILEDPKDVINIAQEQGLVFIKGHIVQKWGSEIMRNSINKKNWENLYKTLTLLNEKFNVNYVTLEEYLNINLDNILEEIKKYHEQ